MRFQTDEDVRARTPWACAVDGLCNPRGLARLCVLSVKSAVSRTFRSDIVTSGYRPTRDHLACKPLGNWPKIVRAIEVVVSIGNPTVAYSGVLLVIGCIESPPLLPS